MSNSLVFFGNPATVVTGSPFSQKDWPLTYKVPQAPSYTPVVNINLFTNLIPVNNSVLLLIPVKEPPPAKEQPNWALNLLLYKNPIPFGPYDYNKGTDAFRPSPAKQQPNWALNLNLYKNNIPFGPYDYNKVTQPPASKNEPNWSVNYNLLIPFVQPPFAQLYWPSVFGIRTVLINPQLRNAEVFSEVPFYPQDFLKPFTVKSTPVEPQLRNPNIFSEVPFYQLDWSNTSRVNLIPTSAFPNIALLNPVVVPFSLVDWSKSYQIQSVKSDIYPNIVILQPSVSGQPFTWQNWSFSKSPIIIVDQSNLPNIVLPNTPVVVVTEAHFLPFLSTFGKLKSF